MLPNLITKKSQIRSERSPDVGLKKHNLAKISLRFLFLGLLSFICSEFSAFRCTTIRDQKYLFPEHHENGKKQKLLKQVPNPAAGALRKPSII